MIRQARAEATRGRIIEAAVQLFTENGYQATGIGDILERAEMTKGAMYHHFDSKDALASAIIEAGVTTVVAAFGSTAEPAAPALETMIHGVGAVVNLIATDKTVRTGVQLMRAFGEFNDATADAHGQLVSTMVTAARRAIAEGDLKSELDPDVVGEVIVAALLGAESVANALSRGDDLAERVGRMWALLLPAITTDGSLPYYTEFLARESLRRSVPD